MGGCQSIERHRTALPLVAALCLVVSACGACDKASTGAQSEVSTPSREARLTFNVFALGRTLGTVAPCGCTTEPLGGLPYAFGTLLEPSLGPRVIVEPGSLLFPEPDGPEAPNNDAAWEQAQKRAETLHVRFAALGPQFVAGLGPTDVAGPSGAKTLDALALPRVLANRTAQTPLPSTAGHRLVSMEAGSLSLQVGITAVVDPELPGVGPLGHLESPAPAAQKEVATMRAAGADVTILLAHGSRPFAESLARAVPEVDVIVVGVVDGLDRQRLGSATRRVEDVFVVEPGQQLQTITHMRLSVDPSLTSLPDRKQWAVVPSQGALEAQLARVSERLERFEQYPEADPAFVRRLRAEKVRLTKAVETPPPPDATVTVTFDQVKITCRKPVDAQAKGLLEQYDQWVAKTNKSQFANVKPPDPPLGEPGYVGMEECEMCHDEAVELWQGTRHAQAYETLARDNKQYDLSCVGCHVTGFDQPGGSHVVQNEGLRDIQCEACHGPGSLHAEEPERDGKPHAIARLVPETVCGQCHTPDHSDTFQYEAYLRDVLGAGHGEAARTALGDGPTGRELRAAGFAKAGGACPKM